MKYQYTSPGFKQGFSRPSISLPSGVKFLLITNIVVFILIELSGEKSFLFRSYGLVPSFVWQQFKIWQLFTYLFIHGDWLHILLNMFMLWVCGQDLETRWGKKWFFLFYFIFMYLKIKWHMKINIFMVKFIFMVIYSYKDFIVFIILNNAISFRCIYLNSFSG